MKELEIGKRYTWEEVKKAYPGKWVRMRDCNLSPGKDIIDGILVSVHSDDEAGTMKLKLFKEKSTDKFRRTEFGMNIGVIECLNARMEVTDEP